MSTTPLTRREWLRLLGSAAALSAVPATVRALDAPRARPSILYILTDQQHAGMLSCAGNAYVKTPNLDRLAAGGMRFERAYCANPVCAPSRVSMFTGQYPSKAAMEQNGDLDRAVVTDDLLSHSMGRLFRSHGYETVYGGKTHLPMTLERIGFDRVLTEDVREGLAESCVEFIREPHDGPYLLVASFINPHDICFQAINHYQARNGDKPPSPEKANDPAQQALAQALRIPEGVSEEDFFANLAPPLPENFEIPANEPEFLTTGILDGIQPFRGHARRTFTEKQWRLHRWAYARLTERVDAEVGRVLDALREADQENDTVVVFSSDHGDLDAAHRLEHKTSFYEEAVRIPFIVRYPGETTAGGIDREHLVSNGLDLIPTLCDYAGISVPAALPGRSVRALARGESSAEWRKELVIESYGGRSLHRGRTKYNVYREGRNREQFIDLQSDPGEMRNGVNDGAHAAGIAEHRRLLREWVKAYGDDTAAAYLVG